MKLIICLIALLLVDNVNAQKSRKIFFSLSDDFSFGTKIGSSNTIINTSGNMINSYRFSSGIEIEKLCVSLSYSYGGQYNYNSSKFNDYNFHLLGLGIKYSFLKSGKINPYISFDGNTEIGSISKGILLNFNLQSTKSNPGNLTLSELSQQNGTNFSSYDDYNSWLGNVYYQKTTMIGSLKTGIAIQLLKQMQLNFGLGIGMRNIKYQQPKSKQVQSNLSMYLDAQLGLSYAFPLKNKIIE